MKGRKTINRYFTRLIIRLFGKIYSRLDYAFYEIMIKPQFNEPDVYIVEKYISSHFGSYGRYVRKVMEVELKDYYTAASFIKWDKKKKQIKVIKE